MYSTLILKDDISTAQSLTFECRVFFSRTSLRVDDHFLMSHLHPLDIETIPFTDI